MAITFSCSCGKPMQAREEHAGRKMKCARCGEVAVIPTGAKKRALVGAGVGKSKPSADPPRAKATVRPAAVALAEPARTPMLARPARRPIPPHDTIQQQYATPWLPADKKRYHVPEPESSNTGRIVVVLLIVLAALGGLGWAFREELTRVVM